MDCGLFNPSSLKLLLFRCLVTEITTQFRFSFALLLQIYESLVYLLHLCKTGSLVLSSYQMYGGLFGEVCIPLSVYCKVVTSFLTSHSLFMVGQTSRALFNAHTFKSILPSS